MLAPGRRVKLAIFAIACLKAESLTSGIKLLEAYQMRCTNGTNGVASLHVTATCAQYV